MRKPLVLIAALTLPACSLAFLPGVYRMDIHQGNIVTQAMVDQLKPSMTKRQVTFIMGTPLMRDAFHPDRWDYIYSNQPGGEDRLKKTLTLLFDGDELAGMQGDFRPSEAAAETGKEVTVNIPKIVREKTLWESIAGLFGRGG
jgi:outer membrane protein assembly factor BamE